MTAPTSNARKMTDWELKFKTLRKAAELAEDRLATLEDAEEATTKDLRALKLLREALAQVQ